MNGQAITLSIYLFIYFPKGLKETITEGRTMLFFAVLTKQTSVFVWLEGSTEVENYIIVIVHFSL